MQCDCDCEKDKELLRALTEPTKSENEFIQNLQTIHFQPQATAEDRSQKVIQRKHNQIYTEHHEAREKIDALLDMIQTTQGRKQVSALLETKNMSFEAFCE